MAYFNCKNPPTKKTFSLTAKQRRLAADRGKVLVAVTLDLEMARHYPRRSMTHWDLEKGNLDQASKDYTLEVADRLKAAGGVLNAFVLGRTLEQENVDWLKRLVGDGHPLGNHTYDHVMLVARRPETVQFRFKRAPWLLRGMSAAEAIVDNIRMSEEAMRTRLGVKPVGFCCPYGFPHGLSRRKDLQQMLLNMGYWWAVTCYREPKNLPMTNPTARDYNRLAKIQSGLMPFVDPSGLVEIACGPLSDVKAFRSRRWVLDAFLKLVEKRVRWAVRNGVFCHFGSHPSCLGVVDPEFRTIDLICRLVAESEGKAILSDLSTVAYRAQLMKDER